tara:strand:+ start:74 stop:658 length:585 start_codon:yes stop_codon:yes gene_type:complete
MGSTLKVDNIVGTSGTSAPITLSGDTATLGSGVTFPSGGHVVQTKSTTKVDAWSSNSTSYTDVTGMSVDITPTSASNKIFVMIHLNYGGSLNLYANAKVLRDSSVIDISTAVSLGNQINATFAFGGDNDNFQYKLKSLAYNFLDSPPSAAALTYKLQLSTNDSSRYVYLNRPSNNDNGSYISGGTSSITVMEVT